EPGVMSGREARTEILVKVDHGLGKGRRRHPAPVDSWLLRLVVDQHAEPPRASRLFRRSNRRLRPGNGTRRRPTVGHDRNRIELSHYSGQERALPSLNRREYRIDSGVNHGTAGTPAHGFIKLDRALDQSEPLRAISPLWQRVRLDIDVNA